MTSNKDVLSVIFKSAMVENINFDGPYQNIKRQLRYYCEDIPSKPRYLYDADAVYFYGFDEKISAISERQSRRDTAERGDIMTSLWTPLTYYLEIEHNGRILAKNNENIDRIKENIDKIKDDDEVFELIENISKNYITRGNLLLLPNSKNKSGRRSLNPDKFSKCEDKIDQFLYYCLDGTLLEYFEENIENFKAWIISEQLGCMFSTILFEASLKDIEEGNVKIDIKDKDINIDNLQSLINDNLKIKTYKYHDLKNDDWKEYFIRLNKVVAYRNSAGIQPHLPFKWI